MKIKSIFALILCALTLITVVYAVDVQTVSVSKTANNAPVAEDISLKTYKSVSVQGTFQAVDPEGDLVSFRIASEPNKGTVVVNGENFVYTPAEGKKGKDSFSYVAVDEPGNVSHEANVSIQIDKQNVKVSYTDMAGNGAAYDAVKLAQYNVFVGEKLADGYHFNPNQVVTRGEFLTMCAAVSGLEPLSGITKTGFSDDSTISLWLKPYVSAALMSGVVQGYATDTGNIVFSPDSPVTLAEAAVMVNNALRISNVIKTSSGWGDSVPAWAQQAANNLYACDVYTHSTFESGKALTRSDAAGIISAAIDLTQTRKEKGSLLSWAF